MEIKNKKFLAALKRDGLEDMKLIRGDGYFYWVSDTDFNLGVALVDSPMIMVCYFKHQSIEKWVADAKEAYLAARDLILQEEDDAEEKLDFFNGDFMADEEE